MADQAIEEYKKHETHAQMMRLADMQAYVTRRYSEMIPDERVRYEFQRDLAYLIQLTYREAQEPMVKNISELMMLYSRPLIVGGSI